MEREVSELDKRIAADLLVALIETKAIRLALGAAEPERVIPATAQAFHDLAREISQVRSLTRREGPE